MNITIGGKTKEVTDEPMEQIKELLDPDTIITISGKDLFELKTQITKLLETELRTPINIGIFIGGINKDKVKGLFFNDGEQILTAEAGVFEVQRVTTARRSVERKLVPINREDLKPGDVVYRFGTEDGSLDQIDDYGIVLNPNETAYATDQKGIHIDDLGYPFWWKVI